MKFEAGEKYRFKWKQDSHNSYSCLSSIFYCNLVEKSSGQVFLWGNFYYDDGSISLKSYIIANLIESCGVCLTPIYTPIRKSPRAVILDWYE